MGEADGYGRDGEFRVPDDGGSVDVDPPADGSPGGAPTDDGERAAVAPAPTYDDVDLQTTPGPVTAAVALGVVAVPLLGVYAGIFIFRWFLQPGVQPDITSSWTGEGLAGIVALVLAIVLLVIVGRAVGGRGLWAFVVAEVLVAAGCVVLLVDDSAGGASVSLVVGVVSLLAAGLIALPTNRRWFAAHAADRARD